MLEYRVMGASDLELSESTLGYGELSSVRGFVTGWRCSVTSIVVVFLKHAHRSSFCWLELQAFSWPRRQQSEA